MAAIPKLACPIGTCSAGGYTFGESWTIRRCPKNGPYKRHVGADLHAGAGTPVVAPEAGTIHLIYPAGAGWAHAILIGHTDSMGHPYFTQLMHIEPLPGLKAGSPVVRGQQVATIAAISQPHLHFAIWNGPYASTAQRGALPDVPPDQTCFDGKYTDPGFPASFVDPMLYL